MCSNVVHSCPPGYRFWGFLGGAGQGQLPTVFYPGPPGINYKAIYRWLLLVLGLDVPKQGQAVN